MIVTDKCWWKGKLHSIFFSLYQFNSFQTPRIFSASSFFSNGVKIVLSLSIEYFVDLFIFFRLFILCLRKKYVWSGQQNKVHRTYINIYVPKKREFNTLRKLEGKTHENIGVKKVSGIRFVA